MWLYRSVAVFLVVVMFFRLIHTPKYHDSGHNHVGFRTPAAQADPRSWLIAQKFSAAYGLLTNLALVALFFWNRQMTLKLAGWLVLFSVGSLFILTEIVVRLAKHMRQSQV
ncbi:SdpI family protein [Agrilactobacillus fermenti]|uniref:SdpI family protein n=1 Tax=Agrilactobacillus fermenti TaxID=2586909 RepID=UPI001E3E74E0|nr:SdpI family protein [Agrilactobacillus fermenti]MCD2255392.1 SdpI family protein [Agrilactobacillus fermenti]